MARGSNTNRVGQQFSDVQIRVVWQKGRPVPGLDHNLYHYDCCGAIIRFQDYGNVSSDHGWEIDHVNPVDNGGTDDLSNLQPLHWKNNRLKGNTPSGQSWVCSIGSGRTC